MPKRQGVNKQEGQREGGREAGGGTALLFFSVHHVSLCKRLPPRARCCDSSAQTRPLTQTRLQSAAGRGMVDRGECLGGGGGSERWSENNPKLPKTGSGREVQHGRGK